MLGLWVCQEVAGRGGLFYVLCRAEVPLASIDMKDKERPSLAINAFTQ